MAGGLRWDGAGVSAVVHALQVQGTESDEHAAQCDAALGAAAGAVTSSPLAGAVQRMADRFRGSSDDVGERMTSLGSSLTVVGQALSATDGALARTARTARTARGSGE